MKPRIKYRRHALIMALTFAFNTSPAAYAEGDVSAEEQRLRDMFLRARAENRRGSVPATTPTPAPAPKNVETPPKPVVKSTPPPAPAKVAPRPAAPPANESSRFGLGSPPLGPPKPPVTKPQAKPTVATTPRPAPVRETPRPEAEESPGIAQKLRDLAANLSERLSDLPRTEQSHAMEIAESEAPAPAPKPESTPVPVKKTATAPPTIAKKPADTRPAPVLKMGPEIPREIEPAAPVAPAETPSEKLMAKVGRSIPEIDVDSLIDDRKIDLKADAPTKRESLAETAESIRRSLLEDDNKDAPVLAMKTVEQPVAPPVPDPVLAPKPPVALAAPPAPELTASKPAVATPPVAVTSAAAPTSGATGMTGAVFERFVRHAMAFAITTVVAPKPAPKTQPEPPLEPNLRISEPSLFATDPEIDPEDDVPDYVKAARKLAEPLESFPALSENHSPPGLNDFVISATHQTDFDMESSSITFSGHVVVESSRFHLTCDKFVVHMLPEQKGMDYGEALGNVVIRMMEDREPTGHTGMARSAIYRPEEGEITLSGWPRIVEETKELVGITADAKMVLSTSGSVRTIGRNRTILKQ